MSDDVYAVDHDSDDDDGDDDDLSDFDVIGNTAGDSIEVVDDDDDGRFSAPDKKGYQG